MLDRINSSYIAGFFDGEGCVSLGVGRTPYNFILRVSITQKDPMVLGWILTKYPSGSIEDNGGAAFALRWCGSNCRAILNDLKDWVVIKKTQVEMGLEYLDTVGSSGRDIGDSIRTKRVQLYESLKEAKNFTM